MTDFTHHTPRLLSDADAAADLAGVARPVSSELPPYIYGREAGTNEKVWTEAEVNVLASERDALAGRVRELEEQNTAAVDCLHFLRNYFATHHWPGQAHINLMTGKIDAALTTPESKP